MGITHEARRHRRVCVTEKEREDLDDEG